MTLIRTVMDRLSPRFVEEPMLRDVKTPAEVPPKAPPMSPSDELRLLEKEALARGMSQDELEQTRRIGDCPAQVQTRIARMHEWLVAR
jgi:hypothetical protein